MNKTGPSLCVSLALLAAQAAAQDSPLPTTESGYSETRVDGDEVEATLTGGVRFQSGTRHFRCDSMVLRMDRDEYKRLSDRRKKGLPKRGTIEPSPRRALSSELIALRLEFFLSSLGSPRPASAANRDSLQLVRSLYIEGNVVVTDGTAEVLTADSLMFSLPDSRVVMKNAVLRLQSQSSGRGQRVMVLRAPKLLKQGTRMSGRDVSLTTCTAGKPHLEVLSAQIEIIERGDEFEVFSRGNNLAFSGRRTLPLPNAHFFTGDQSDILLRGIRGRYSSNQGVEIGVDLGSSMNDVGGSLHNFLTGRPAEEFRGEWRLGLGLIETRGYPIDGELKYRAGDLYEGRTNFFYMGQDDGPNRSFLQVDRDGSLIDNTERTMIRSLNRFNITENWRVDLTAFAGSDPNVMPEFFLNTYEEAENPESSVHVRHADENRLFTLTGRTNLATFSYGDDRAIASSFRNEMPLATYDLFSEPLFAVGDTDVLLTSSTNAGWLRREFDSSFPAPVSDRTFRFDQEIEVAAPFMLGDIAVRPRLSGRFTYYDNTVSGDEAERWAFDAGVSLTTRLAKTFTTSDAEGNLEQIRHSIYPSVSFGHAFQVDGRPAEFHQFDEIDSLNENGMIRVGLLNRFHSSSAAAPSTFRSPFDRREASSQQQWPLVNQQKRKSREFLWIDLAQNFFPIADRDNGGDVLGIAEYEVIWRPQPSWIPVKNLSFLFEGEHDWNNDRARTFNSLVRFGPVANINWYAGYRTDYLVDGQLIYALSTDLFGRWTLVGSGSFDLQQDEQLYYNATLVRRDHDWVITVGLNFDVIQNDTTFRIDFEPLFGGLSRRRQSEFAGMSGRGSDAVLNY